MLNELTGQPYTADELRVIVATTKEVAELFELIDGRLRLAKRGMLSRSSRRATDEALAGVARLQHLMGPSFARLVNAAANGELSAATDGAT